MKRLLSISSAIFIALCLMVASERRAYAYVDPGTGLIALQTFASILAAYAYVVRRRIRAFFNRKKDTPAPAAPAEPTSPSETA